MTKEIQNPKKDYVVYQVNGETMLDFADYKTLSNIIRNTVRITLPNEEDFDAYVQFNFSYTEKNKSKMPSKRRITKTNLTIKIAVDHTKDHKEEFSKIKENLEKILDSKLKILEEKD